MKKREKNEVLNGLIEDLYKKAMENGTPIWKAVALGLNRPGRKMYEVNLFLIENFADNGGTVVVPGAVLGNGELKKKVTVAALKFSGSAKEKIEKAGGKCMEIRELFEKNPKGSGVKILG